MITQLMAIESQPLTRLETKEASYLSEITAFGNLKSALATFQTTMSSLSYASTFQTLQATVADSTVASVSASAYAQVGAHSLKVTQLAQSQILVANGQTSTTSAIGSGTISIDFGTISGGTLDEDGKYTDAAFASAGGGIRTITIDSSNNSLSGIRDAINNANIGVTASVINDGSDTPYRLSLTVNNSGLKNSMSISVSGDAALQTLLNHDPAGTQNLSQTATAQNAEFLLDGIAISKEANNINDVLSGVSFNLLKTNSTATTLNITRDTSGVSSAVESFVSAYNELESTLDELTAYDTETEESGLLNGDSTTRNIRTQLRKILTAALPSGSNAFSMLSQVGISVQKDGSLALDSDKLKTALKNSPADFAGLFAAAGAATDGLITYNGAGSNTKAGNYAVNITQLATQGNIAGTGAAGLSIASGLNDTLHLTIDGVSASITLTAKTYDSTAALVAEIQSKINGAKNFTDAGLSVSVSQSNNVLTITSNTYGSTSKVLVTGGNASATLKLDTGATATTGLDVAGTIGGNAATGSGQTLTSASGDASGIGLVVAGGSLGLRGTVTYSQGYAYQLNSLLLTVLDEEGVIANRIDGLNESIADIDDEKEKINSRLEVIEARYRTQFSALEVMLSNMQSTSEYLTQQLEALASLRDQS
ncbi:MAG: flagellar hook protein FliD [Oxalobacter sp.]|nr:MAG: flagellar hook protein FliD [Oxalobacter sp.]